MKFLENSTVAIPLRTGIIMDAIMEPFVASGHKYFEANPFNTSWVKPTVRI
jgi:hypothetical protein